MPQKATNFIICSTARTGSYLLCDLLEKSGVAGQPTEMFEGVVEDDLRKKHGLEGAPTDVYIKALQAQAIAATGRFGFKLHSAGLNPLLESLRGVVDDGVGMSDLAVLEAFFPGVRFIYLSRDDFIAQAISMRKATSAQQFMLRGDSDPKPVDVNAYSPDVIERLLHHFQRMREQYEVFFAAHGITPLRVYYEDLSHDRGRVFREVLAFLGEDHPEAYPLPETDYRKQADAVNDEWYDRFLVDGGAARLLQAVGGEALCAATAREQARLRRYLPSHEMRLFEVQQRLLCEATTLPPSSQKPLRIKRLLRRIRRKLR